MLKGLWIYLLLVGFFTFLSSISVKVEHIKISVRLKSTSDLGSCHMLNTLLPIQQHRCEPKPWAKTEAQIVLHSTAHMLKAWWIPPVFVTSLGLQQDETWVQNPLNYLGFRTKDYTEVLCWTKVWLRQIFKHMLNFSWHLSLISFKEASSWTLDAFLVCSSHYAKDLKYILGGGQSMWAFAQEECFWETLCIILIFQLLLQPQTSPNCF